MVPSEIRRSLSHRMSCLGVAANVLAEYSGVNKGQISTWLNGKSDLSLEKATALHSWLTKLENVHRSSYPIPVDFADVGRIRTILNRYPDGNLKIKIEDSVATSFLAGYFVLAGDGYVREETVNA
jgi:transcriptional regulator with XRE-family HTH domain